MYLIMAMSSIVKENKINLVIQAKCNMAMEMSMKGNGGNQQKMKDQWVN